jgi:hypothetical protein
MTTTMNSAEQYDAIDGVEEVEVEARKLLHKLCVPSVNVTNLLQESCQLLDMYLNILQHEENSLNIPQRLVEPLELEQGLFKLEFDKQKLELRVIQTKEPSSMTSGSRKQSHDYHRDVGSTTYCVKKNMNSR